MRGSWEHRIALARSGWETRVTMRPPMHSQDNPVYHVSVHANTQIWNGRPGRVVLHLHDAIDILDPAAAGRIDALCGSLRSLCERAQSDFPEAPPCMTTRRDADGVVELVENSLEARAWREYAGRLEPTESIPPGQLHTADPTISDALVFGASRSLYVEDIIDPYFGPARFLSDCQNRKWGHRLRMAVRIWGGERVVFNPMERTSSDLSEIIAETFVRDMIWDLGNLFLAYSPEGRLAGTTENGLPPGYSFLERPDPVSEFSPGL